MGSDGFSWGWAIVLAIGALVAISIVWWVVRLLRCARGGATPCACGCSASKGRRWPRGAAQGEARLVVVGMKCPHCEQTVRRALSAIDGVKTVMANHQTGEVSIRYNGRPETIQAVRERLAEVGFPAE